MKRTVFLGLLLYSSSLFGQQQIQLHQSTTSAEILSVSESAIVVKNQLSGLSLNKIDTPKGSFNQISVSNYSSDAKPGTPELPMFYQLIHIPAGAEVVVTVADQKTETIDLDNFGGLKVFPNQPSISKSEDAANVPFHYIESAYAMNAFSNDPVAIVETLGKMRSKTIGRLRIAPFSYNPVTNELKVITEITVTISFKKVDKNLQQEQQKKYRSELFDNSFQSIIGYKETETTKDLIVTYPTTYVIVSDPMFENALQPFVEWKTLKGFKVIEAYTNNPAVGTTTASIKAYLQGLYTNATPNDPAPSYVLFVGDIDQVPSFPGQASGGGHVTDLYYCEYDGGNDYFPEVYYGRFSANNVSELQPQIDKTIEYEKYLFPDDAFLDNAIMISGVDGSMAPTYGNGQINYGTSTYFNTGNGFNTSTWLYPESEGNVEGAIKSALNAGACFVNYTAHGYEEGWADPSLAVSDVSSLTNSHKYPTMIGNCCLTNTFTVQTCFGESLMRAANKGAIGYIGGSNVSYWDEDYDFGVGSKAVVVNPVYDANNLGMYDCAFHQNGESTDNWYVTQSQFIFSGNMAVTASGSGFTHYYWEIYHLMGDPSLMTYFKQAAPMIVTHVPTEVIGVTSLTVNAEPHAYVAVSQDGVLLDARYTGVSSSVVLNFAAVANVGELDVVVTKQNKQPYFGTVEIIAPSNTDYIVLNAHAHDDAAGNNNNSVDYNETIVLDVELKNVGDLAGNNVVATLSTTDTYVTITDNTENWGTINAGDIEMITASYGYQVANNVPDQHVIDFLLTITDDAAHTWTYHIYVTVNAPEVEVLTLTIDDSQGNNNGHLDAGESAVLSITAKNNGHAALNASTGSLTTGSSDHLTITSGSSNTGLIQVGNTVTGTYGITVSASTPYGTIVSVTNVVGDAAYSDSKIFEIPVGLFDEDFETNSFEAFNWNHSGPQNWITTSENPYEGAYCSKSGGINDNQETDLSIQLNVQSPDEISFMKKVSSEEGYDFLVFSIDGTEMDNWSGEQDWSPSTYAVSAGTHTFTWTFRKDESVESGSDAAWLDNIVFPPASFLEVADQTVIHLNVYPNPVNDELTIDIGDQFSTAPSIIVRDAAGRIVYQNDRHANGKLVVNSSTFAAGFYVVEVRSGAAIAQQKIIKH